MPLYRRVVEETIDYVLREMTAPDGGFYSTQDADSEGEEGKFFVWTPAEIDGDAWTHAAASIFESYYGVSDGGNFEGKNILYVSRTRRKCGRALRPEPGRSGENAGTRPQPSSLPRAHSAIKPGRDEKILAEWNGLMIHALAECGAALGRAGCAGRGRRRRRFYPDADEPARRQTLPQPTKMAAPRLNAYLEDYAAFARAWSRSMRRPLTCAGWARPAG